MKNMDMMLVVFESPKSGIDYQPIGMTLPRQSTPVGTLYLGGEEKELAEDVQWLLGRGIHYTLIVGWIVDWLLYNTSSNFCIKAILELMGQYRSISLNVLYENDEKEEKSRRRLAEIEEEMKRDIGEWVCSLVP